MSFDLPTRRSDYKKIFTDPNSFTTTLTTALIDVYGTDYLAWSPETIRLETEEDFGFKWPQANFDRVMAGMALLTTDRFYKSLPDFIDLCNVMSGSPLTPGVFDPADAGECAWGLTEALLLAPPEQSEVAPFSPEIVAYIGKVCDAEGIITPPDILRLGSNESNRRKVHGFSDDPEMFNAIWDLEASKTEEINTLVKERLTLLVNQLASLDLANGKTGDITKKMLRNLETKPEGGSPL